MLYFQLIDYLMCLLMERCHDQPNGQLQRESSLLTLLLILIGLFQVVRHDRLLRRLQQGHPGLRDGDEGQDQRLSSGMLRLPAVQSQVKKMGGIIRESGEAGRGRPK